MASPLFSGITKIFTAPDVAVDMGTANTRLFAGPGLVIEVPTATGTGRRMGPHGQLSGWETTSPVKCGIVRNVPAAARLLRKLFRRIGGIGLYGPRVVLCVGGMAGPADRAALTRATRLAGASAAALVPAPLAAAIGAGMDVSLPYSQMIVDIGDGSTDIAVIREGELVYAAAAVPAGYDILLALRNMAATRYQVEISREDAELLGRRLGAADHGPPFDSLRITGTGPSGIERRAAIAGRDVRDAVVPVAAAIVENIVRFVRELPPKDGAEVIESGICLTGGVASLTRLADLIAERTQLPVAVASEPLFSVVNGAGRMLKTVTQTGSWQVSDLRSARADPRLSF